MRTHSPASAEDVYASPPDSSPRVREALVRAREDARAFERDPVAALASVHGGHAMSPAAAAAAAPRAYAVGDPQASLARFLDILDRHGLLADDGRVARGTHLVSMGDHFDWGQPDDRAFAAESGFALLAWLAAQPAARVTILFGNHDLARVGELAPFDDHAFREARTEALALRGIAPGTPGRAERRRRFLDQHPSLPGVGIASRDLSTFEARQRALVAALLAVDRMLPCLAFAGDLLLIHAPVTTRDLDELGLTADDPSVRAAPAVVIARALHARVRAAWSAWDRRSALSFGALYQAGSAATGESRGVFVQRPADPDHGDASLFAGPPRRRFDPRELPRGLVQVIGHIRDNKCRELMARWSDRHPPVDGPLRHLWTDGTDVRYRRGLPDGAAKGVRDAGMVVFADGGMQHARPEEYELFELRAREARRSRR